MGCSVVYGGMSACNIKSSTFVLGFVFLPGFPNCRQLLCALSYCPTKKGAYDKYPMALMCWAGSQEDMSLSCLFQSFGAKISVCFITAVWTKASYLQSRRDSLQRMLHRCAWGSCLTGIRTDRLRPGLKPGKRDSSHSPAASHAWLAVFPSGTWPLQGGGSPNALSGGTSILTIFFF